MTAISEMPGRSQAHVDGAYVGNRVRGGTSWGAILAGTVAAVAATTILLILGTGVGLSAISPFYGAGASATAIGVSAVIWLIVVQWISSALGGFLAARLRTRPTGLHLHETFFRDTAHGFLAWALATIAGALIFAAVTAAGVTGVAKGTADVAAATAGGAASAAGQAAKDDTGYFVDTLFRSDAQIGEGDKGTSKAEITGILGRSTQGGQVAISPDDKAYMAKMVAARTGIPQADAEQRIDTLSKQLNDAQQKLREAADAARKRAVQVAFATALSMLVGAFIAAAAGALGGSFRDEDYLVEPDVA